MQLTKLFLGSKYFPDSQMMLKSFHFIKSCRNLEMIKDFIRCLSVFLLRVILWSISAVCCLAECESLGEELDVEPFSALEAISLRAS